jgi:hypothetical protein
VTQGLGFVWSSDQWHKGLFDHLASDTRVCLIINQRHKGLFDHLNSDTWVCLIIGPVTQGFVWSSDQWHKGWVSMSVHVVALHAQSGAHVCLACSLSNQECESTNQEREDTHHHIEQIDSLFLYDLKAAFVQACMSQRLWLKGCMTQRLYDTKAVRIKRLCLCMPLRVLPLKWSLFINGNCCKWPA